MLNSYEIAGQLKNRLHLKAPYTLKDVCYKPYGLQYCIYIEDTNNKITEWQLSSLLVEGHIEALGKRVGIAMIEEELNNALKDVELDELVEYYYKKGMHMAEINKRLMTGGLSK